MKRIQLFEFEDFAWFPETIRIGMTNLLVVLHNLLGTKEVVANLITKFGELHHFSRIIDLGSGSGGIMPSVIKLINSKRPENKLHLLLTDLHPNKDLIKRVNASNNFEIRYHEVPIDAANLKTLPLGLKTMINSFHHMPPLIAKGILKSAQNNNQPILIYEIGENKMPILIWWLLLPLSLLLLFVMSLFMTPFVRPINWKQLFFTYLIPIIPICYAWDGQASMVRMYTFKDIQNLINDFRTDTFRWEMGQAKKTNGKTLGYYVFGYPV